MAAKPLFHVTGPGLEDKPVDSIGVGLSTATTFACRAKTEATYYVRDAKGDTVGYADRDEHGCVEIRKLVQS